MGSLQSAVDARSVLVSDIAMESKLKYEQVEPIVIAAIRTRTSSEERAAEEEL